MSSNAVFKDEPTAAEDNKSTAAEDNEVAVAEGNEPIVAEDIESTAAEDNEVTVATTFSLYRTPPEIQTMIWKEVLDLPACHTFVLNLHSRSPEQVEYLYAVAPGRGWHFRLEGKKIQHDNSSFRQWHKLMSLNEVGFDTAFRLAVGPVKTIYFDPWSFRKPHNVAIIAPEKDLIILDFTKDVGKEKPMWWQQMLQDDHRARVPHEILRTKFEHFTKVAIHYRPSKQSARDGGPFYCPQHQNPNPPNCCQSCGGENFCALEVAAFLRCFPNIKVFYFIVHPSNPKERDFAKAYKNLFNTASKPYLLSRVQCFSDQKFHYLLQAPPKLSQFVQNNSPWALYNDPGVLHCLTKVMNMYTVCGSTYNHNTDASHARQAKQLRTGILISYRRT